MMKMIGKLMTILGLGLLISGWGTLVRWHQPQSASFR